MGVYGLVNGQWQFFPNSFAAESAGATNVRKQPPGEGTPKPGGGPPNPKMYWDESTSQWRFPQPDGSTPGAMPSIGVPPGSPVLSPFPPGDSGEIAPYPPGQPYPPISGPPGAIGPPVAEPFPMPGVPVQPPAQAQPVVGQPVGEDFSNYVRNYGDLANAFKKYQAGGGTGDINSWGRLHYKKHGQREGRKVPGGASTQPEPPQYSPPAQPQPVVGGPVPRPAPQPVKKPPTGVIPKPTPIASAPPPKKRYYGRPEERPDRGNR